MLRAPLKFSLLAVALLGLLAVAGLSAVKNNRTKKTPAPQLAAGVVSDQAAKDAEAKNYDAATAQLKTAIDNSQSPQERYNLRLQLGAIYMQMADYQNARATFKAAHNGSPVMFPDAIGQANASAAIFFQALKKSHDAVKTNDADRADALDFYNQALALTTDKAQQAQINQQIHDLKQVQ